MKARVVGVGCMKTGTKTLGDCLKRLGYRHQSYHYPVVREFMAGNKGPALDLLSRFESFDDWPFFVMYREIADLYPDARFVLTVRKSPEVWLESIKAHTMRTDLYVRHLHRHFFGVEYPHNGPQAYLDWYQRHNEEVRQFFGSAVTELCWDSGDGWTELCSALGEPAPDEPLPHANRGRDKKRNFPLRALNTIARAIEAKEIETFGRRFPSLRGCSPT
jgi:hypothetical protein